MTRGSLQRRVTVALALVFLVVVLILGGLAFDGFLFVEDAVLEKAMGRVLDCADDSGALTVECFGAVPAPADLETTEPGRVGEAGGIEYIVDGARRFAIESETYEVLDPFEVALGAAVLLYAGLVLAAVLFLSVRLARLVLRPLLQLERTVARTPPTELAAALSRGQMPVEVDGLRARLVDTLGALDAAATRERLFSRYVSHELRTPLAVCRAAAELLDEPSLREAARQRAIARLDSAVRGMEDTTRTLLALARGQRSETRRALVLHELVDEEIAVLAPDAARRDTTLRRAGAAGAPVVVADTSLRLALRNLISNALRHAHGGEVVVTVATRTIEVADDGPGISEEDIDRLQRPFEREAPDGHGLGLSLVRDLSELERWRFTLSSPPGSGLRAHIEIEDDASAGPGSSRSDR